MKNFGSYYTLILLENVLRFNIQSTSWSPSPLITITCIFFLHSSTKINLSIYLPRWIFFGRIIGLIVYTYYLSAAGNQAFCSEILFICLYSNKKDLKFQLVKRAPYLHKEIMKTLKVVYFEHTSLFQSKIKRFWKIEVNLYEGRPCWNFVTFLHEGIMLKSIDCVSSQRGDHFRFFHNLNSPPHVLNDASLRVGDIFKICLKENSDIIGVLLPGG